MATLKITLALYAAQLAPRLPSLITDVFQNTFVKILSLMLIAYLANVDFQLSILLAIVFVIGGNLVSGRAFHESFGVEHSAYHADSTKYTDLLDKPATHNKFTLLDGKSDIYSGCQTITLKDLLEVFDGDALKLQTTTQYMFKELLDKLPADSDAKSNLISISKVAGLPYNELPITDENAPLIATMLLNVGFNITKTCQPPNGEGMIN
jgi:hypothetical protein